MARKSINNPQTGKVGFAGWSFFGKGSAGDQMCVGAGRRCCGLAQTRSGHKLDWSSLDGSARPWAFACGSGLPGRLWEYPGIWEMEAPGLQGVQQCLCFS